MRLRYILFASTVISILFHFMPKHAREIMIDFINSENYEVSTEIKDIPKFALNYLNEKAGQEFEIIDSIEFKKLEAEYNKEMKIKDSLEYLEYKKVEAEYIRVQDSIEQAENKLLKDGQFIIIHRRHYNLPYLSSPSEQSFSINKNILKVVLYNESTCLLIYENTLIDFIEKEDNKIKHVRYDLQDTLNTVNSIKNFFANENSSYSASYNSFE